VIGELKARSRKPPSIAIPAFASALEIGPRRRVGVRQEAHREANDHRLHARLEQRYPGCRPEHRIDQAPTHAEGAHDEDSSEHAQGGEQRRNLDLLCIDRRDYDEREEDVYHDQREDERPQAVRKTPPHEREQAERESRVGRHRDAPAVHGRSTHVEGEVDGDCSRHPADRGQQRQREPSSLSQLAQVELAPCLEPQHEEEECHQPAVHPVAKIERDTSPAEVDRERRLPERVVGGRVDVDPHERSYRRKEQDRRAASLRAQKLPQRRLELVNPDRTPRERLTWPRRRHALLPYRPRRQDSKPALHLGFSFECSMFGVY
jgi:hypothetical protein